MNTLSTHQSLHPMQWITSIALVLFAVTGIAVFTGIIPSSKNSDIPSPAAVAPTPTALPAAVSAASAPPAPETKVIVKHVTIYDEPRPATRATLKTAEPMPVMAPVVAPIVEPTVCYECGYVESVQRIGQPGIGSGLGTVAGGVIGGALGNRVGQGNGRTVATVVGLVSGAIIGNNIEKSNTQSTTWQTLVRFENGSTRVFNSTTEPVWRNGERVRLINGFLQSA